MQNAKMAMSAHPEADHFSRAVKEHQANIIYAYKKN
jgi:hypothetical protein